MKDRLNNLEHVSDDKNQIYGTGALDSLSENPSRCRVEDTFELIE